MLKTANGPLVTEFFGNIISNLTAKDYYALYMKAMSSNHDWIEPQPTLKPNYVTMVFTAFD